MRGSAVQQRASADGRIPGCSEDSRNEAETNGGGIAVDDEGQLVMDNRSPIIRTTVGKRGGGIVANAARATIVRIGKRRVADTTPGHAEG